MKTSLTENCIYLLLNGCTKIQPFLQIVGINHVNLTKTTSSCYCIFLSDGTHWHETLLPFAYNDRLIYGDLHLGYIANLNKCTCRFLQHFLYVALFLSLPLHAFLFSFIFFKGNHTFLFSFGVLSLSCLIQGFDISRIQWCTPQRTSCWGSIPYGAHKRINYMNQFFIRSQSTTTLHLQRVSLHQLLHRSLLDHVLFHSRFSIPTINISSHLSIPVRLQKIVWLMKSIWLWRHWPW